MSPTEPIRAFIWDMGGVLVRTDVCSRGHLASQFNMTFDDLEELIFRSETALKAEVGHLSKEVHWDQVGRNLHLDTPALSQFERAFWIAEKRNEELLSFVSSLRTSYLLGLLSNGWVNARDRVTQQFGFLELFDEAVFSGEVGFAKPNPRIYRLMLNRLGVEPSQAVFIDDNLQNVEGARAVGLQAIRFDSNEQLFETLRTLI